MTNSPRVLVATSNKGKAKEFRDLLPSDFEIVTLTDLGLLRRERYDHRPLLGLIWQLRHSLTTYDAAYVALAAALEARLVTADRKLARSSGHEVEIEAVNP